MVKMSNFGFVALYDCFSMSLVNGEIWPLQSTVKDRINAVSFGETKQNRRITEGLQLTPLKTLLTV
jgi:hypothetical protein